MITWKDEYSVKFEGIDEQHKTLISIIQEVEAEINSQKYSFKDLIDVVNKLDNYTMDHLTYEEKLIKKYGYAASEKHLVEHNELRYKIQSINYDNIGDSKEFFIDTYTYLYHWLINHIAKTDRALGAFLVSKAAE
jgi:hemerythrin-like metal-binding protein